MRRRCLRMVDSQVSVSACRLQTETSENHPWFLFLLDSFLETGKKKSHFPLVGSWIHNELACSLSCYRKHLFFCQFFLSVARKQWFFLCFFLSFLLPHWKYHNFYLHTTRIMRWGVAVGFSTEWVLLWWWSGCSVWLHVLSHVCL
jgi:hypothetical protein